MKRICVNCGSSPGFDPCYMATARRLGLAIIDNGLDLVYGGADIGLLMSRNGCESVGRDESHRLCGDN